MLSIILTILKIIGIILLVILGVLLLVLMLVLFVPVRYKSQGMIEKTDEGIIDKVAVKVTWLLRIASVNFMLDGKERNLIIRIFGIKLSGGRKEKADKHKGTASDKVTEDKHKEAVSDKVTEDDTFAAEFDSKSMNSRDVVTSKETKSVEASDVKVKKNLKEKVAGLIDKIQGICQKIKNINEVKNSFIEYLKRDESKEAIRHIKEIIFKVLKHILPQKLRAKIVFGFEDPSTTGNVLGVASIFYGIYGEKLELEPDFEHKVLKAEYKLKGRIRVFSLIVAALRIYRNKWIRRFIAFSKENVKKV